MARIRTLKPEIWMSPQVMNLSHSARLLFIGLITQADDEGRGTADARRLKASIFGGDDYQSGNVRVWLTEISAQGLAIVYETASHGLVYELPSWKAHQRIEKAKGSNYPSSSEGRIKAPTQETFTEQSTTDHGSIPGDRKDRKGSLGSEGSEGSDRIPTRERETPAIDPISDTVLHEAGIRAAYPPFTGRQDWISALHLCRALVDQQQATWTQLAEAAARYAVYCHAGGVSGPQFVLTPAKFFGGADKPWAQLWAPPPSKAQQLQDSDIAAGQEWLARSAVQ